MLLLPCLFLFVYSYARFIQMFLRDEERNKAQSFVSFSKEKETEYCPRSSPSCFLLLVLLLSHITYSPSHSLSLLPGYVCCCVCDDSCL